jgi:putative oxidoreductase
MVSGTVAGGYWERPMTAYGDRAVIAVSLGLAGVFIYAGVNKFGDPLQFADSIAAFAILPSVVINLLALSLPPFEIGCGLLLLWSQTRRVGALSVALLSLVFFTSLLSALVRGLTLDCGCFGVGAPSRPRMWLELGLNTMLFAGALFVYVRSITLPRGHAPAIQI